MESICFDNLRAAISDDSQIWPPHIFDDLSSDFFC